jgi:threonine/homoserine/homoserine lactone efflux protein|tara:strand:- start:1192 stop:1842 length:651 start_codon:yes stop_codon:yes gene_type:complete
MIELIQESVSLPGLLLISAIISLSGILMPGPVFAIAIAKGHQNKFAGAIISLGHGLVEFPLMILIYIGLLRFFTGTEFQILIAFLGGIALIYLGYGLYRSKNDVIEDKYDVPWGTFTAGAITTLANPYFFMWWVSIGAVLILSFSSYGFIGFLLFAIVHWLCDFFYNSLVSFTVFKSKRFWNSKVHGIVFGGCGLMLITFGIWFIYYFLDNIRIYF